MALNFEDPQNARISWLCEEPSASEVGAVRYGWLHWIFPKYLWQPSPFVLGRDIVIIIATGYRLDGPGIESRWGGARFSVPVQTCPRAHPASCKMGAKCLSRGVKRPGRGVDHPPHPRAEVKERVELYLLPPSGPSWPALGWILPLFTLVDYPLRSVWGWSRA
jgi:hypothetical protein